MGESVGARSEAPRWHVLVIDDDELATTAIKHALESAGFAVWTLLSPVGASRLIERSRIDAAVIDVNMPLIPGDRMVRLLRGWDQLRELPVVLVSGMPAASLASVAASLDDVSIVTKARVASDLAPMLLRILSERDKRTQVAYAPAPAQAPALSQSFVAQIPDRMSQALALWERLAQGHDQERPLLRGLLHMLKGQSQLLGFDRLARMFNLLLDVVAATPPHTKVDDSVHLCVCRAFGVVSGAARSAAGVTQFEASSTFDALESVRARLSRAQA